MTARMQTDSKRFQREIRTLAKITGESVSKRMEKEVGIVAGSLMRAFPPKTAKEGKQAIGNDMMKVIFPMHDSDKLTEWQDQHETEMDIFDDTGIRIQQWYERHRNRRTGRTRAIREKRFYAGRNWTQKLHVNQSDFNKFYRQKTANVGKLKAGWIPAMRLNPKRNAPGWVRKHPHRGGYSNRMRPNGSGHISFWNSVPYAGRSNFKSINNFVMRQNSKRLVRVIRAEYRKAIKKAGG